MKILKYISIIALIIGIILLPLSCVLDNSHIRLWGNYAVMVGHAIYFFSLIKREKGKEKEKEKEMGDRKTGDSLREP